MGDGLLLTILLVELEDMIETASIASLPNYYFFHMTNVSLGLFHLTFSNAFETIKLIASRFLEFFDEEVKVFVFSEPFLCSFFSFSLSCCVPNMR